MIGIRLRLARQAAGMSLRDLAAALHGEVSAQAIGKYERSEMQPSSRVLMGLSKALNVTPEYLLRDDTITLTKVDFRKANDAGAKEERAVEAAVLDHVERYLFLEQALNMSSAHWSPPQGKDFKVGTPEDAENAADSLRGSWKLGRDALPCVVEILEQHGVKVFVIPLPNNVSGSKAFVRRGGNADVPVIVVNRLHTGERQRFTMAHELAHLVMHPKPGLEKAMVERLANRFSGAFFVPSVMLRSMVGDHRHSIPMGELIELKRYFKVSVQPLLSRCHELDIITTASYQRQKKEIQALGWMDPPYDEPAKVEPEIPMRMDRLGYRAVSESALSHAKAAELLRISVRELDRRLSADTPTAPNS